MELKPVDYAIISAKFLLHLAIIIIGALVTALAIVMNDKSH